MGERKKDFQIMMEKSKGPLELKRAAFQWAMNHWRLVENLCEQENPLSFKEFEKESQRAINTEDCAYYALLVYLTIMSK